MEGYLSKLRIDYVLFHLNLTADINSISKDFVFVKSIEEIKKYKNKIIFVLSSKKIDLDNIYFHEKIPILYPGKNNQELVSLHDSNLVFNHDILKSAFYLLSGYQETINQDADNYGRYQFKNSIQKKLNIVNKPIVNYYFHIITDAINSFLEIEIKRKKLFENFGLILTHDIDNIDYFTFPNFLYKIKEFLGLSKTKLTKLDIIKYFVKYLSLSKDNPYYSFEKLIKTESAFNYKSCFYFLMKEQKNIDSTYNFSDKRIKKAFEIIKQNNCEIGLHGTVKSATKLENLIEQKTELTKHCDCKIYGGRQHRLVFEMPKTLINQDKADLKYDSSLCFAEHEGFRNSFCLPYKLYDFKNERTIDVWEFPLIVMDVTLFHYQKYTKEQAIDSIENLIEEIKKFSGLFTLLWHNGFEVDYPNGSLDDFYVFILKRLQSLKANNILAKDLIKVIDK